MTVKKKKSVETFSGAFVLTSFFDRMIFAHFCIRLVVEIIKWWWINLLSEKKIDEMKVKIFKTIFYKTEVKWDVYLVFLCACTFIFDAV